jgi:hypothetical protein
MSLLAKHTDDLAHVDRGGWSLFRLLMKRRENARALEQISSWHEEDDGTVIGYEASWAAIFPRPVK